MGKKFGGGGGVTRHDNHPASIPKGVSPHVLRNALDNTKQEFGQEGGAEIKVLNQNKSTMIPLNLQFGYPAPRGQLL